MTREATADPWEASVLVEAVRAWGSDAAMARLDRQLGARVGQDRTVGLTISAGHREEAALIARRYGYELHVDEVEEPDSLWAEFRPVTVSAMRPYRRAQLHC
ncbi:hypothetical protein [Actinomycetospora sp.]|jgi:hypothetical protein|uniref:hypothetical protein n=1 Tax=Actinomycetospora sp. TaxID=1872135 RepID=UPI002F4118EF